MPDSPRTAAEIRKLIDKVMPELANFIAGRRGFGGENMNYQGALLRDSLKELNETDRKKFLSQSVHGNNPVGYLFSGLEKTAGLKFSTSLEEVIKRYDNDILENKPAEEFKKVLFADDLGKPLARERADGAASKKESENDAATKIKAAFKGYIARKDKDPASLVDSASERSVSPPSLAKARAALPKVDKKATLAMLAGFEPTANTVRNHKIAQALVNSASKHLGTIKEPLEEDFSQGNPIHSDAARATPVSRGEGPLSKTDAARMKTMDAYNGDGIVHIRPDKPDTMDYFPRAKEGFLHDNPMRSNVARTTTMKKSKDSLLSDKPDTTKPSEEDAERKIQSGFRKRNKLAISAIKMAGRIASRKGSAAEELKAMVSRTIKENTVRKVATPKAGLASGGLRKTGRDLTK